MKLKSGYNVEISVMKENNDNTNEEEYYVIRDKIVGLHLRNKIYDSRVVADVNQYDEELNHEEYVSISSHVKNEVFAFEIHSCQRICRKCRKNYVQNYRKSCNDKAVYEICNERNLLPNADKVFKCREFRYKLRRILENVFRRAFQCR